MCDICVGVRVSDGCVTYFSETLNIKVNETSVQIRTTFSEFMYSEGWLTFNLIYSNRCEPKDNLNSVYSLIYTYKVGS